MLDGDQLNLPRILSECGPVNMFHYDSDKSRSGREFALNLVTRNLVTDAPVVFDDVADNLHFRSVVKSISSPWVVTGSQPTVGVIWRGLRQIGR